MTELILASSSRYRAELLAKLDLPFTTCKPDIDESPKGREAPHALVLRLAEEKARAIASDHKAALIIGSDQVAVCEGEILGKPGTETRACEQLSRLSGNAVLFLTGLCLLDTAGNRTQTAVVDTIVHFRNLTADEIRNYVSREQPLDCAGAFKSEALGIALFDAIETTDPNALIGLPLIELCRMLRAVGVDVLASTAQRSADQAS